MSPIRYHGDEHARRMINGQRPSPLKINNSTLIHKPSSNIHHSSSIPAHQHQKPVIIYYHSPKIIHTQPRDFMALVQKLTGPSGSLHQNNDENCNRIKPDHLNDNEDSSVMKDKKCGLDEAKDNSTSAAQNPFMVDMPLFTPTPTEFFCSPRPRFRYSEMVSWSPNMTSLMSSPSFMEVMKGLPEY